MGYKVYTHPGRINTPISITNKAIFVFIVSIFCYPKIKEKAPADKKNPTNIKKRGVKQVKMTE
jgi:hypothetical protein